MRTTVLFLSFLLSLSVAAQFDIPNGDFEEWQFNGWNYSPVDWQTNNTQLTQDVFQDSAAYEGVLAMKVEATIVELGSYGEASIQIPTVAIPPSLDFYAKWQRTYTASVAVEIIFYNQDLIVYQQYWTPEDTASGWVPVSMPLDQIEPVMTHVVIKVTAFVGDFAPGEGWISVDAMSVGGVTAIGENDASTFSIHPNPANDRISLEVDEQYSPERISILDALGREVLHRPYERSIDVDGLPTGRYVLSVFGSRGLIGSEPLIIR